MININPGDLVTLKGMSKSKEKPIGIVKKKWSRGVLEIFWVNEDVANRYAVNGIVEVKKLEVISEANR
tara:strand:+ start:257 stop:460 length:204 start_codon:yes stop_codon:yes gene_type:complete